MNTIDMAALAFILRAAGHTAEVAHTGGGIATLYVGDLRPDAHGDLRYGCMAGPGRFLGRDYTRPVADPTEFTIGLDDDGSSAGLHCTDLTGEASIAGRIIRFLGQQS